MQLPDVGFFTNKQWKEKRVMADFLKVVNKVAILPLVRKQEGVASTKALSVKMWCDLNKKSLGNTAFNAHNK